jgi:hypothetical protein
MLLRDGVYMTEEPEVLKLTGVYVAATGRLHAHVQPARGPLTVPLGGNSTDQQDSADYR